MSNASSSETPSPHLSPRVSVIVAVAAITLVAGAAGLTKVWNYDVHWHLAAGQWMLEHRTVLDTDPFSVHDQDQWTNVHWLFQLLVAAVHAIGGFGGLTLLKSAGAAATLLILAMALRKRVPPAWLMLALGMGLWVMLDRIRVRPEIVTLVLLAGTIAAIESVRRGASVHRLWALAPIMLLWVNMHGLFVLGLAVIWSSIAGAAIDRWILRRPANALGSREALLAAAAATVAALISPWPVSTFLHPFLLWTRVSGQDVLYSKTVSELKETWRSLGGQWPAISLFALAAVAMEISRRRKTLPTAHVFWAIMFAALALTAKRNVGLMGPVFGYLLALHGGRHWRHVLQRWHGAPAAGAVAVAVCVLAAAAAIAGFATEWTMYTRGRAQRFGLGRQDENYPLETAAWLKQLPADGDLMCLNFGDASTFICYAWPQRKVWMDGRLEAHSYRRYRDYYLLRRDDLSDVGRMDSVMIESRLPAGVEFYFVSESAGTYLSTFSQSRRFRLAFVEPGGACFVRTNKHRRGPAVPMGSNLSRFERPLKPGGALDGPAPARRTWHRQNVRPQVYRTGQMLMWLGRKADAVRPSNPQQRYASLLGARYLTAAMLDERLLPAGVLAGMSAQGHHQFARHENMPVVGTEVAAQPPPPLSPQLPVNLHMARAMHLYRTLPMEALGVTNRYQFGSQHIAAMHAARQFDTAKKAVDEMLAVMPEASRIQLPKEWRNMRNDIDWRMEEAFKERAAQDFTNIRRLDQARILADRIGLVDEAVALLRSGPADAPSLVLLGDLLLRKGMPDEANDAYRRAQALNERLCRVRQVLCAFVRGEPFQAERQLTAITADPSAPPMAHYYHALILEYLGNYARALRALDHVKGTEDPSLAAAGARLNLRLLEH